ncbi:hypothetical protein ACE83Q_03135 [Dellaglioa sp. P0083]|uniref:hypothetical protein n=1 Tax=Dellaglioa kimchii TaxID=3344667 RepID=UPI0038D39B5C
MSENKTFSYKVFEEVILSMLNGEIRVNVVKEIEMTKFIIELSVLLINAAGIE